MIRLKNSFEQHREIRNDLYIHWLDTLSRDNQPSYNFDTTIECYTDYYRDFVDEGFRAEELEELIETMQGVVTSGEFPKMGRHHVGQTGLYEFEMLAAKRALSDKANAQEYVSEVKERMPS